MSETVSRDAGRDLDALVAEKIFGWPAPAYITDEQHDPAKPIYAWRECHRAHEEYTPCEHDWNCGGEIYFPAPNYSTDIRAAWEVVEKVWPLCAPRRGMGTYRFQLHREDHDGMWGCELATDPEGDFSTHKVGKARTAPHAICLAALKAVGA